MRNNPQRQSFAGLKGENNSVIRLQFTGVITRGNTGVQHEGSTRGFNTGGSTANVLQATRRGLRATCPPRPPQRNRVVNPVVTPVVNPRREPPS
jgi:hypothetical protein